jgi:hypothetical protein
MALSSCNSPDHAACVDHRSVVRRVLLVAHPTRLKLQQPGGSVERFGSL